MRLKHPLHHRDQDRLHYKSKGSSYVLTTLPLRQASAAPRENVSESPVLAVGKKYTGDHQLPPNNVDCFVGASTLILPQGDCRGIFRAQSLRI